MPPHNDLIITLHRGWGGGHLIYLHIYLYNYLYLYIYIYIYILYIYIYICSQYIPTTCNILLQDLTCITITAFLEYKSHCHINYME